jgi:hypothetical protein
VDEFMSQKRSCHMRKWPPGRLAATPAGPVKAGSDVGVALLLYNLPSAHVCVEYIRDVPSYYDLHG